MLTAPVDYPAARSDLPSGTLSDRPHWDPADIPVITMAQPKRMLDGIEYWLAHMDFYASVWHYNPFLIRIIRIFNEREVHNTSDRFNLAKKVFRRLTMRPK